MQVFVDADGCPVVDIVCRLCREAGVACVLVCDTAHRLEREHAQTVVVDQGADSVDFALVNRVRAGDVVITQDYGLASMCLARQAIVLHQDGWRYCSDNIDALLFSRHAAGKYRRAGGRVKGPSKRTEAQNKAFQTALQTLLQGYCAGGS